MNSYTGEIGYLSKGQQELAEQIASGMNVLPRRLHPFAALHMEEHPGKPVDLDGDSELAVYARKQREKSKGYGKCKNRPS